MSNTIGNRIVAAGAGAVHRARVPGKPGLWEAEIGGGRLLRLTCLDPSYRETEGLWLTPGLFDIQVNGIAGTSFVDANLSVEQLAKADERIRATGTAWYCPTLVTRDNPTILSLCRTFRNAWEAGAIPGAYALHLEGPFISSEDGFRGVHQRRFTRDPDIGELQQWQEASGGKVRIVTLAPERAGSAAFIEQAARQGIVVSVGHSNASEEDVRAAAEAGARLSTHLFNGCAPTINRHRNPIYSQLAEDRLFASFIADGHHIPLSTLKVALRAKGVARSILVSDLAHLSGLPDGDYEMEGAAVVKRDGGLFRKDGPILSGAARSLAEDVAILGAQPEPGIEDTFLMATEQPARLLGAEPCAIVREGNGQRLALWEWRRAKLGLVERLGF
jgi:N-acetylglucosamine-6-phosphate deacetylase